MNRLRKLRQERNLTQEFMANYVNKSRPTYTRWETGENEPDIATIDLLAKFFNVSVDYLLCRSDDPTPPDTEKEPTPEIGSFEWFRQGLVARGIIKDGEDLTDEQLQIMLVNIGTIVHVFKQNAVK